MPGFWRKLQGLFMEKPPNFSRFTETVYASGLPSTKNHIRFLEKIGVSAIVSLTEQPLPSKLLEKTEIVYSHFPLKDHQPARPEDLMQIVKEIKRLVENGGNVLVHCQAGLGRTGMVLAAYIMATEGLGWRESLAKVRQLRPGSVEKNQEKTLEEFERLLRAGSL